MNPDRFDALIKIRAGRYSRRTAMVAASTMALAGLVPIRASRRGTAQNFATPAASPSASPGAGASGTPLAIPEATPGPLDLVTGSPPASDGQAGLGRLPACCNRFDCLDQAGIRVGTIDLPEDVCPDLSNPSQARQACNSAHSACAQGCRAFCSFAPAEEDLPGFTPA